jgi:hypothetical protein
VLSHNQQIDIQEDSEWLPQITEESLPDDFPLPCIRKQCARDLSANVVLTSSPATDLCACGRSDACRNPFKWCSSVLREKVIGYIKEISNK